MDFPVQSVSRFRALLEMEPGFRSKDSSEPFSFVISGTAHAVTVDRNRPWTPFAMRTLKPDTDVVLGTPDEHFFSHLCSRFGRVDRGDRMEVSLEKDGYNFSVRLTSAFTADTVRRLNLPKGD